MKFKVGDIVRYAKGSTALMRITTVMENYGREGQTRYYGHQFFGHMQGAYDFQLRPASEPDIQEWMSNNTCGRQRNKFLFEN